MSSLARTSAIVCSSIINANFNVFLVVNTRLYTLSCRSVSWSVGRSVSQSVYHTFSNSKCFFFHYCSCPSVHDWIVVYLTFFFFFFFFFLRYHTDDIFLKMYKKLKISSLERVDTPENSKALENYFIVKCSLCSEVLPNKYVIFH